MKTTITLTIVFLGMLLPVRGAVLELKESADVTGSQLTVADLISTVADAPSDFWTQVIGSSPMLGQEQIWNREAISRLVRQRLGNSDIQWQGANQCKVRRPAKILSLAELRALFIGELTRATGAEGQVDLLDFSGTEPFLVPVAPFTVKIELSQTTLQNPWSSGVLRLNVNHETLLAKSIRFRWSWSRTAWQLNKTVNAGESIGAGDVKVVNVDVLQQGPNLLTSANLPEDIIASRGLQAGKFISSNDYKTRTLVKRGSPVKVHVTTKGLNLSMQGIALEDGSRGTIIGIQNPTSKKRLMARIVDDNNLELVQ